MTRLFLAILLFLPLTLRAQLHPTVQRPKADWMQLNTPHFRILYPAGYESTAIETGKILESQVEATTVMFGSSIEALPVVIDPFSHAGNGYVTVFPYRIEYNTAPVKGMIINPRSGTWLEAMLPHELVHAAHINTIPETSIPKLLSVFSPDFARAMHFTTPAGVLEGLAVHHESNLVPGYSGRLNYPYFRQQYNGWGVWSSIMPAGATWPMDRHYIGGALFSRYLIDTYGEERVRNLVRAQAMWPFFGFGFQMKRQLGDWSWDVEKGYKAAYPQESEFSKEGEQVSRPLWINDTRILTYRTGYRMNPGFYETNVVTGETVFRHEARLTEDDFYSLTDDRTQAVFSRYAPHPVYPEQAVLKSHALDLTSFERTDLAEGLHTVVLTPDTLIGLRPVDQMKQRVIPNPAMPSIHAVIQRVGGMQGLWLVYPKQEALILSLPPDISFPMASVLDASWSADGLRLMLTSDVGTTTQVYEYDYEIDVLYQITDEPNGALDGSISPDGRRYAYVAVRGDQRELVIAERGAARKTEIPREVWTLGYREHPAPVAIGAETRNEGWSSAPVRGFDNWIAPKLWLPMFGRDARGVFVSSGDVLRRHAYDAYLGFGQGQAFYDLSYTTTAFPRPVTLTSSKLSLARNEGMKMDYVGYETSNRIQVNFTQYPDADARYSQFTVSPFFGRRTVRFEEGMNQGFQVDSWFLGTDLIVGHRLRQFLRDPQPSAGFLFYGDADMDLTFERRHVRPLQPRDPARAFRGLAFAYTPIGLRLDGEVFLQNIAYYDVNASLATNFDTRSVVDFDSPLSGSLGARYAFPMFHPDTKWPLMPFYSERFYGVVFGKTVADVNLDPRSVLGAGIRFRTRLGNINLDLGAGLAWEPATGDVLFTSNF